MNADQLLTDPAVRAELMRIAAIGLGILIASYLYFGITLTIMAKKSGTPHAWLAWVPPLNLLLMIFIARKPWWWLLLLLVPLVNVFVLVLLWPAMARTRGKPSWVGWLILVPGVNLFVPACLAAGPSTVIGSPAGATGAGPAPGRMPGASPTPVAAPVQAAGSGAVCGKCGAARSGKARFCGECGTEFPAPVSACPACGARPEPGDRYCGDCGHPLAAPAPASPGALPPSRAVPSPAGPGPNTSHLGGMLAGMAAMVLICGLVFVGIRTRFWEHLRLPFGMRGEANSTVDATAPEVSASGLPPSSSASMPVREDPAAAAAQEEVEAALKEYLEAELPNLVPEAMPAAVPPSPSEPPPEKSPPEKPPAQPVPPLPPLPPPLPPEQATTPKPPDAAPPAVKRAPGRFDADMAFSLGVAAWRRENVAEALQHFRRAVEIAPDRGEYRAALAGALWRSGLREEAEVHAARARELGIDDHWGLREMSRGSK